MNTHEDSRGTPPLGRYTATLVGLVVGQVAGSGSVTVAKVILFYRDGTYSREGLAEASLHVLVVLACLGGCWGAAAAFRGWTGFEQILTSALLGAVVAFLAIVDYSLPSSSGDGQLSFSRMVYYFVGITALWFLPYRLLPTKRGRFSNRVPHAGELLVLGTLMGVVGFLTGLLIQEGGHYVLPVSVLGDPWFAKPAALNGLLALYVGVAFIDLWWPERWRSRTLAWLWTAGVTSFVAVLAGIYGVSFYNASECPAVWRRFLAFGTLPAAAALGVTASHAVRCAIQGSLVSGWLKPGWFWALPPLGLAGSVGLAGWYGFTILGRKTSSGLGEMSALLAYSVNGCVLGLMLCLVPRVFGLIRPRRDGRERAEN